MIAQFEINSILVNLKIFILSGQLSEYNYHVRGRYIKEYLPLTIRYGGLTMLPMLKNNKLIPVLLLSLLAPVGELNAIWFFGERAKCTQSALESNGAENPISESWFIKRAKQMYNATAQTVNNGFKKGISLAISGIGYGAQVAYKNPSATIGVATALVGYDKFYPTSKNKKKKLEKKQTLMEAALNTLPTVTDATLRAGGKAVEKAGTFVYDHPVATAIGIAGCVAYHNREKIQEEAKKLYEKIQSYLPYVATAGTFLAWYNTVARGDGSRDHHGYVPQQLFSQPSRVTVPNSSISLEEAKEIEELRKTVDEFLSYEAQQKESKYGEYDRFFNNSFDSSVTNARKIEEPAAVQSGVGPESSQSTQTKDQPVATDVQKEQSNSINNVAVVNSFGACLAKIDAAIVYNNEYEWNESEKLVEQIKDEHNRAQDEENTVEQDIPHNIPMYEVKLVNKAPTLEEVNHSGHSDYDIDPNESGIGFNIDITNLNKEENKEIRTSTISAAKAVQELYDNKKSDFAKLARDASTDSSVRSAADRIVMILGHLDKTKKDDNKAPLASGVAPDIPTKLWARF